MPKRNPSYKTMDNSDGHLHGHPNNPKKLRHRNTLIINGDHLNNHEDLRLMDSLKSTESMDGLRERGDELAASARRGPGRAR